ncbi:MAG: nitrilase-related carbon-nitrogen hydrolase [Candidatus Alcyoniella australis]|nr:nitrilase-related carbon-nitrogen hydrolase [Candidatus Alcyoniella australis]
MKIAVVQIDVLNGQREENLRRIERRLRTIDVELAVLPELVTSGYLFADRASLLPLAEPAAPGAPSFELLKRLARRSSMHIVAGFPELCEDRIYNSAMLVGPEGLVGVYRKTHLFDREHSLFDPGDSGFRVFDLPGLRLGIMICFDWAFPESARSLVLAGAQLIAHPANLVLPYFQNASITRALENRLFIATANRIGIERVDDQELTFTGRSQIVAPDGRVLARADGKRSRTLLVDIDPRQADDKHLTPRDHLLQRRRPELYRTT